MRFGLLFMYLMLVCCSSSMRPTQNCQTFGTVFMSSLEQCGFLIELQDGTILMPTNRQDFDLYDGQQVLINFEVKNDMASICMQEDKIVKITCLSESKPKTKDCMDFDTAEEGWIRDSLKKYVPTAIWKYEYLDGWAYLFDGMNQRLYDCQATLLCSSETIDANTCDRYQLLKNRIELFVSHR